ncbi:MAG: radical SAM protein [Elusimicrobia bacterium]|nr:radical SAM protein [Elusimicrobiota bacterium]
MNTVFIPMDLLPMERVVPVSADYLEVLGTDRHDNVEKYLGPSYLAYRKNWSELPRTQTVGDYPLHLDVEAAAVCNLRCTMCQIPFDTMPSGLISIDLFKKIMDEIRLNKAELPSVKFNFRGEPTLHPRIAEFVRLAREAGIMDVQFNTNGTLLNEKLSRDLIAAGLVRIKFSLDSMDPSLYDAVRKGAHYEKTLERILEFIRIRNEMGSKFPSVMVQMVYMSMNQKELKDYIHFWEDKVNRIGISRYRSGNNEAGEDAQVKAPQQKERFPCPQLWQRMVILFDGTVLMCCGDHHSKNPIGDIKTRTIRDLWHSPELTAMRQLHREQRYDEIAACKDCQINCR